MHGGCVSEQFVRLLLSHSLWRSFSGYRGEIMGNISGTGTFILSNLADRLAEDIHFHVASLSTGLIEELICHIIFHAHPNGQSRMRIY